MVIIALNSSVSPFLFLIAAELLENKPMTLGRLLSNITFPHTYVFHEIINMSHATICIKDLYDQVILFTSE